MVVSKEIARLEHSAVKLTVTVGKNDVKGQYDDLIKSYGKSIQIKGFRKGMVPRDVLERKPVYEHAAVAAADLAPLTA